jgi:colanic acid/amylovoran biosynthesis protein
MRIILDTALNNGAGEYTNMGDVSMLQVAVTRLNKLWPSASIEVLTESPENLARYCPHAMPLPRVARDLWVGDSFLFGRLHAYFPRWLSFCLDGSGRILERKWPALISSMVRFRLALRDDENICGILMTFLKAMENADLFVVCGSGGFADSCRDWNMTTLRTMEVAIRRKIPVAMFGQGMGPLSDSEALFIAKTVFPAVSLITLRGGRGGLTLLESLGVEPSTVLTTGDEAIELAYDARPHELGRGLGVNLRVTSYANVDTDFMEKIRPVLQECARRHNAPMIPVPIAFHSVARDHQTIQQLLAGYDDQSDGGLSLDTPLKVIHQAGRCRVVVTGAYHAAVFALAQGIPVVCLANSPYYGAKFLGLEDQFGLGCETVFLNDPDVFRKTDAAIERAWQSAENVRVPLQQAAHKQSHP